MIIIMSLIDSNGSVRLGAQTVAEVFELLLFEVTAVHTLNTFSEKQQRINQSPAQHNVSSLSSTKMNKWKQIAILLIPNLNPVFICHI